MTRQQINLYPAVPSERSGGNLAWTLFLLALFTLVLIALGAREQWRNGRLKTEQATLQAEVEQLTRDIDTLRRQIDSRRVDPRLAETEERLKKGVHRRRRILQLILDESQGNTHGFSDHMEALASSDDEQLWLEHILFRLGGRSIALTGRTLAAEELPDYIQRLGQTPAFGTLAFNYLEVLRPEPEEGKAPGHRWTISTERPDAGGAQ